MIFCCACMPFLLTGSVVADLLYHDHLILFQNNGEILCGTDFRIPQFPKKKDLIDAAKYYNVEVNEFLSKAELNKLMLDYLVQEELIAEPKSTDKLRGQQLLELKCLEFQEREHERENQFKLKELKLKEKACNTVKDVRVRISFTRGACHDYC